MLSTAATGASSTLGSWVISPDALSRPPTVTDGKGQTSTYSYDGLDRPTGLAYPNGPSFGFGYDPDGRRTSLSDTRDGLWRRSRYQGVRPGRHRQHYRACLKCVPF